MKKALFILFLTSFSFSFAQVARVVQSKASGGSFSSGGIAINGEFHEFHLVGLLGLSNIDQIQYNVFDSTGNMLKLEYIQLPYILTNAKLTGVFLKSTNKVILYTVRKGSSSFVEHDIIEIDISTHSFVQNTLLSLGDLVRNTSQTIELGGKYVSYVTVNNVGLKRVSVDKTNFSSIQDELVDATVPNTSNVDNISIGFSHIGSTEFVGWSQTKKIYKRPTPGNYLSSASTIGNAFNSNSVSVSNLKILSTIGNAYSILDLNLNILSQGTLSNYSPYAYITSVYKSNYFYLLIHDTKMALIRFDINLNNPLTIFQNGESSPNTNLFIRIIDNKLSFSFSGFGGSFPNLNENGDISTTSAFSNYQTTSLWLDETKPFIGFLDVGKELKAKDFTINTGQAYRICDGFGFENPTLGGYSSDSLKKGLFWNASNLLVGQNDTNLVGTTNRFDNKSFLIGPYTDSSHFTWKLQSKYSRRYYVTTAMIANHLQQLQLGTVGYIPEYGIREWPGNGDVSLGQAPKLAAFHDENGNGIYEPMLGDYPTIFGDECVFTLAHTSEGTPNTPKVELHSYRFRFECDENEVVENTIFQKNFFIARGMDIDSVYLNNFYDLDLGNAQDDYVGTNVELGMVYAYNGDDFDESGSANVGWGAAPPAFGIMTLQGAKQVSDGNDNAVGVGTNETINGVGFGDGISDNEYWGLTSSYYLTNGASFPNTDPQGLPQFYQVAQGNNSDGSAQTFTGFTGSLGIPVHHAMLGTSDPLFYSSGGVDHGNNLNEFNFPNPPGDRRIMSGSGPSQLHVGDTLTTLIALVFSRDTNATTILEPVNKLFADAAILKSLFLNNDLSCGENFDPVVAHLATEEKQFTHVKIYPNPTKEKFYISGLEGSTDILLFDLKGSVLIHTSTAETTLEMDLTNLAEGMYFVQLHNSKGSVLKKVVRN